MEIRTKKKEREEEILFRGVLRLNAKALGLALGLISGCGIFFATNWLVLKGGNPVGPHLQLLSHYLIGYRVSFLGSFIGFFYGFIVGSVGGVLLAWVYNRIVMLRHLHADGAPSKTRRSRTKH